MTSASPCILCGLLSVVLLGAAPPEQADRGDLRDQLLTLLPETEQAARTVLLTPTLTHSLPAIHFDGSRHAYEFLLDRLPFATKIARRLSPPLERYTLTERRPGLYQVDDQGALRGELRLLLTEADRRLYLAVGQFRSLANLLTITGRVVILLEYRESGRAEMGGRGVITTPVLYLKIDNIIVHTLGRLLPPLLRGIIERRSASLITAVTLISERMAQDPDGLYQEMTEWREVTESEREKYREMFLLSPAASRNEEKR